MVTAFKSEGEIVSGTKMAELGSPSRALKEALGSQAGYCLACQRTRVPRALAMLSLLPEFDTNPGLAKPDIPCKMEQFQRRPKIVEGLWQQPLERSGRFHSWQDGESPDLLNSTLLLPCRADPDGEVCPREVGSSLY